MKLKHIIKIIKRRKKRDLLNIYNDLLVGMVCSFFLVIIVEGMTKDILSYTIPLKATLPMGILLTLVFSVLWILSCEKERQENIKKYLAEDTTLQFLLDCRYILEEEMEELEKEHGSEK
jgi:hypothetical protein